MTWKGMAGNRRKITAVIAGGSILGSGSAAVAQTVTAGEKAPAQAITLEETVASTTVESGSVEIPTATLLADTLDGVDESVDVDSADDSVDTEDDSA